jgi:hypothetical protein
MFISLLVIEDRQTSELGRYRDRVAALRKRALRGVDAGVESLAS